MRPLDHVNLDLRGRKVSIFSNPTYSGVANVTASQPKPD